MTYKYFFIRREMYEKKIDQKLQKGRSLTQMMRLYKLPYVIILVLLLFTIISVIIISILSASAVFMLFPAILLVIADVMFDVPHEDKIYNMSEREREIEEYINHYKDYIKSARNILKKHGIDNEEKNELLKAECISRIEKCNKRFLNLKSKIIDMFVFVPLGAFITLITENNKSSEIIPVFSVIFIGIAICMIIKAISMLLSISDTIFKDRYLLDVLTDLEYEKGNDVQT